MPELPAEATVRSAGGVVPAPAVPLDPNSQPSASAPAPPRVLGQQGGQALMASLWTPNLAPCVSGGGSAAGGGPVLCREQPAAARAQALTVWEAELYRAMRPLPQSKQNVVLHAIASAFPGNDRVRFRDARALRDAYAGEQMSLSPCCPFVLIKLPAHCPPAGLCTLYPNGMDLENA